MAVKKKKYILLNEKGQALIEFILFFPFLLMMYSVTLSVANSINASINQQKATRGYFYYRLQNNSTAPTPDRAGDGVSFSRFGQHVNLWGEKVIDKVPVAACFKFNIPLQKSEEDICEKGYTERTTQFIRVGTAYGICGATYHNSQGVYTRLPNLGPGANAEEVVADSACQVSQ